MGMVGSALSCDTLEHPVEVDRIVLTLTSP